MLVQNRLASVEREADRDGGLDFDASPSLHRRGICFPQFFRSPIVTGDSLLEVSLDEGIEAALRSLLADRLSILAGAGLSMAPPSCLPSAADLAEAAKLTYEAQFGTAPFGSDIAEQVDYFFGRGELATIYLRTLIDKDAFAGPPNFGHTAVADLILVGALKTAVTTNVDTMIETAGQYLFGHVESGVDANAMALIPAGVTPLLKIHGCRQSALAATVWSVLQLGDPTINARIAGNAAWLSHRLANRDLLIVGYSTDWDYLNQVLDRVVGAVTTARVIIVDPLDGATLTAKAPILIALGARASVQFLHVRSTGDRFLDLLRRNFSQSFVRQVLHRGREEFTDLKGSPPDPTWLEPPDLTSDAGWQMRRDLEGCGPRKPAKESKPTAGPMLGMTLLQLRAAGAVPDGPVWSLGGKIIRVLRADGKALHKVQAEFDRDTAPVVAPDIVIAVGAEDFSLPAHVVRGAGASTITRGASGRWVTRKQAEDEIAL